MQCLVAKHSLFRFGEVLFFSCPSQRKPGDWDCANCHTVNFKSRTECKQCGSKPGAAVAPAAEAAMRPGDWRCALCDSHNFASRDVCKFCQGAKGGRVEKSGDSGKAKLVLFRKGDWLCPGCEDHQFAANTSCRKCGKSRPAAAGEEGADGSECIICFENVKTAGLLHGDDVHVCCCKECAGVLKQCPLCRAPIDRVLNVYQ